MCYCNASTGHRASCRQPSAHSGARNSLGLCLAKRRGRKFIHGPHGCKWRFMSSICYGPRSASQRDPSSISASNRHSPSLSLSHMLLSFLLHTHGCFFQWQNQISGLRAPEGHHTWLSCLLLVHKVHLAADPHMAHQNIENKANVILKNSR